MSALLCSCRVEQLQVRRQPIISVNNPGLPPLRPFRLQVAATERRAHLSQTRASVLRQHQQSTVATYPEPETEKERSPLDYPQVNTDFSFEDVDATNASFHSASRTHCDQTHRGALATKQSPILPCSSESAFTTEPELRKCNALGKHAALNHQH